MAVRECRPRGSGAARGAARRRTPGGGRSPRMRRDDSRCQRWQEDSRRATGSDGVL